MIVLAVLITLIFNSNIINANDCQYPTSDGIFDLRTFGYSDRPKYTNMVDSKGGQLEYSYNGCFSYKTNDNCKNAAACVTDLTTQTSKVIARQTGRTFSYNAGLSQMVYTDGGDIKLLVFLICNLDKAETVKAGRNDDKNYFINFEGPCACPGKCIYKAPGLLSGGAIFVILLICLIATYLIGGIIYQRFVRHNQGIDLIPNRLLWIQMGSYSLGGVRLLVGKVTGRRNLYEPV